MTTRTPIKLTNRLVAQLEHKDGSNATCTEHSDNQQPGLKLQVYKSSRKFWWFRYTLQGKKCSARIGEFPGISLEEARNTVREMRAQLDRGLDPKNEHARSKTHMSFQDYASKMYLPWARSFKRSARSDESKLAIHLGPVFNQRRLADITTRDIHLYLAELSKTHAPATCNRHLALMSKMFRLAIQWGEFEAKNPCEGIDKFKENNQQQNFLSQEDVRKLMTAARNESNKYAGSAIQFLIMTGVRREEALQAQWVHVDLVQATLFLPKTKSGKSRYVVLNDTALNLLRSLPRIQSSPWVFPGKDPMKPLCNPTKAFGRILKAAGLPKMRLHDCRHTYASMLVNGGASLYQVQALLGHASPQTTQRYSHLASSTLRDISQMVSLAITD